MSSWDVAVWGSLALLLPFVVYVVVKRRYGLNAGVVVAIGLTLATLVGLYVMVDGLDSKIVAAAVVVCILGAVSLKTQHPLYFRLEPAIKGLATVVYLFYFRVFGPQGVFESLTLGLMAATADGMQSMDARAVESVALAPEFMRGIESHFMLWLTLFSLGMIYVAIKWNDVTWLVGKMFYVLAAFMVSAFSYTVWLMVV